MTVVENLNDTTPPLKGQRASAWTLLVIPFAAVLIAGAALGWINAIFAVALGVGTIGGLFLWVDRHDKSLHQHYADIRGEDLRRALRSQRLALGVSVIDGLPDPLLILNNKRDVTLANHAARELLGRAVVGRDLAFTMRQPHILAIIDRALQTATPGEGEVTILAPVSRDFHVLVAPLLPQSEEVPAGVDAMTAEQPAVALSLHEITEIRRAESMRAEFVANASHELKTPLANLVGFIETLKGPARDDDEARDRFLDIMQAEAGRMSRLISDLLSLSRIEQDEHMQPVAAVDLRVLLDGVIKLSELRAAKNSITIATDFPEDLPAIQGDSDQLMQVFQNLLDNSIKYGRPKGTVRISAKRVDRLPQGRLPGVLVLVEDEGEGIPAEHLPRLTERFYRVDTGRSRKLGGTGLGLAIVKHIVRRHRGWLDIASQAGKGTTVTIGLPVHSGSQTKQADAGRQPESSERR